MFSKISKLDVKNLVINGVHGSTGREPHDKQRFLVDISIDVSADEAADTDSIKDAFDYKVAMAIAQHVVGGEKHVLIEKIAHRIASRICQYSHVLAAEVTVSKLDASQRCVPSFTGACRKTPMEQPEALLPFDVDEVLARINANGAASVPILPDSYRKALLEEADMYEFQKQDEIVGPAKVREQLSSVHDILSGSLFERLRDDFQGIIRLPRRGPSPFQTPLDLNEIVLQKYEAGSIGITPHKDFANNINLICVFILAGRARFALCDDRAGNNARDFDTTPGNVILMRAPGFMSSDFRPFHFVSDVTELRTICAIRQLRK